MAASQGGPCQGIRLTDARRMDGDIRWHRCLCHAGLADGRSRFLPTYGGTGDHLARVQRTAAGTGSPFLRNARIDPECRKRHDRGRHRRLDGGKNLKIVDDSGRFPLNRVVGILLLLEVPHRKRRNNPPPIVGHIYQ